MAKKKREPKVLLEYDTADIWSNEITRLMEDDGLSKDDAEEQAYKDTDYYQFAWDDFVDNLSEELDKRANDSHTWRADGRNMGWMHHSGWKEFRADDGRKFLDAVLPKTDCHITIYKRGKRGFTMRVGHHDAPMGEWYDIRPLTKKEYENFEG